MKIRQTEEAFGQGVTPVRREVEHLQVPEIVEGRLLNFLDKIVPQVKVGEVRVRGQAVVRQHSYPVHRHVQDLNFRLQIGGDPLQAQIRATNLNHRVYPAISASSQRDVLIHDQWGAGISEHRRIVPHRGNDGEGKH